MLYVIEGPVHIAYRYCFPLQLDQQKIAKASEAQWLSEEQKGRKEQLTL